MSYSSLVAAAVAAVPGAAFLALRRINRNKVVTELTAKIAKRQAERKEHLEWAKKAAATGCPEQKREEIGRLNFDQLQEALRRDKYSCSEVVAAYLDRNLKAHEKTNCVTLYVKECVECAKEWDEKAKAPGFAKPPLFGIPISVKECTPMKGYDVTRGYAKEAFMPMKTDAQIIEHVKELGGIPFVLTNVPFSLLVFTCGNLLYGWTKNPFNPDRTPGGSSGGEGALIGAGGSILGIGSDTGGSIRVPCHWNGIAGFKPSHMRLSRLGLVTSVPGRVMSPAAAGPIDVSGCVAMLREMWKDDWISSRDPYVPPVRWNDKDFKAGNKYTIGYYMDDGYFTPTPGVVRAVEEAKGLLERKGHKLVPFKPIDASKANDLFLSAVSVDGGKYLLENIAKDIPTPEFESALKQRRIPLRVQRVLGFIAGLRGEERVARMARCRPISTSEMREHYAAIGKYRTDFMDSIDCSGHRCHSLPSPAAPHTLPLKLCAGLSYTGLYSLLDFGAGAVGITKWNEEDERKLADYPETDRFYRAVKQASKGSVGLPLGVQIASPPFKEELALRVLLDLEDARNGKWFNRRHD